MYIYIYILYIYMYFEDVSEIVRYAIHFQWVVAPLELRVVLCTLFSDLWRNPILWMRCQTVKAEKMKSQSLRDRWNRAERLTNHFFGGFGMFWNMEYPQIHCFTPNKWSNYVE